MNLSSLIEKLIYIKGEPINTKDYTLFVPFYNSKAPRVLLKSGRQVGKSTAISCKQCVKGSVRRHSGALTVHPMAAQSYRFSRLYIDPIIMDSPYIKERYDSKLIYTVHLKQLSNFSTLHFSYVGDDPDRIRGISVNDVYWDEIQQIPVDHIPIVEQCTSHFDNAKFCYAGTPATMDNTIESLWKNSSQLEPYINCTGCNFDNFCFIPDVYKMLQKNGLSCQKCGRLININNIKYKSFNPEKQDIFDGMHIPQIFVPFNLTVKRWKEIMDAYETVSEFTFATEILGISFDAGGRPVTLEKLVSCCEMRNFGEYRQNEFICKVLGIDWGCATKRSYTVITVIGITYNSIYKVIYAQKYPYRDRLEQMKEILNVYNQFGCNAVGADAGVGLTDNLTLRKELGPEQVFEFDYCSANFLLKYNKNNLIFITSRTKTLSLLFNDLNRGIIKFPKYELMSQYFEDILSEYEEISMGAHGEHKLYKRNASMPDDFLHSLNFAMLTAKLLVKENILCSIMESDNGQYS